MVTSPLSHEDERVLNRFLDRDTLVQIPARQKKRLLVLRWLASKFSRDREYPEREVNAILSRHHPDFAYLRRLLVDHGFMTRASGIYRRCPEPTE